MTQNGSKVLHHKGAILAKKYKLPLRFVDIDDFNSYTIVEDTNIKEINLSYRKDYIKYRIRNNIYDKNVIKVNRDYFVHRDYEKNWLYKLAKRKIKYQRKEGYSKITVIDYTSGRG